MNRNKKFPLDTFIGLIGLFLVWESLYFVVSHPVIPEPIKTIRLFIEVFPILLPHIFSSLFRILSAILISFVISVPLGIWIGSSKWADRLLSPLLYFIYPIPKVAFLPVFMLVFGLGDASKISLVVWIIVFQLILSVRDGINQIDQSYYQVMQMMHASKWQTFIYLLYPAILPQIISGLRVCIGIAVASLFFAENYATQFGLGYYIMNAWSVIDYSQMFCGILALCLVGFLLFKLIDLLEWFLTPWNKSI
ncbi:NitT/TauT family transport system permease protein [Carnobacterium alterfunditum]|uniref:NitT/TauT family transport system permease protein n=1 Tax=Carnobacterium alterfunditum TaxID=28230 RepID=A0A1N6FHA8_9LACT|nr:ABC transporter permease [Carnobacterium alterfunditum]SIN94649.1 NitT/TauT family transport system permease protein [Carnobacterium alterfunditum]